MKLKKLIDQYIIYRKSLGEKFEAGAYCLKAFYRLMGKTTAISKVSSKKIIRFLYGEGTITTSFFNKHSTLKGFYNYCISRRYVRRSPLPTVLPKKPASFVPYIYSDAELKSFFAATLTHQKHPKQNCVDPYAIHVLFILLYGTGLRIREALSLTMGDVDLPQSILTIKNTKFYKTRLVPFGKHLSKLLEEYIQWRKSKKYIQEDHAPFFLNKNGEFLIRETVNAIFERICKKAGIKRTKRRPRIHDFRHTFAVHRIISWYQKYADVQNLLPLLSVYMGHVHLSSTSVYLTMTPELLHLANKKFEGYVKGGAL